jgi:hypothetical protein
MIMELTANALLNTQNTKFVYQDKSTLAIILLTKKETSFFSFVNGKVLHFFY